MPERRAAIVTALRTPFGRYGGALSTVRPDDLAAHIIKAVVEQSGVDPTSIADVYFGAANQAGEDNRNCLLYTSPSPRDKRQSRMPSSA